MSNDNIQDKIRTLVYSLFAVIVGIILIRILLGLVGANLNNEFAHFWYYDVSDVFVRPFEHIYTTIDISATVFIEVYSIIAMLFYMMFAIIASKSASSLFEDSRKQVIMEIVDSLFKIAEFLLATRFIFKLTAASTLAPFVRLIYDLSTLVYEPFESILPAKGFLSGVIEFSTLIALVIVIILDIVTEQFLFNLLSSMLPDKPKKTKSSSNPSPAQNQVHTAQPQNININMPQQPPQYVDQRSVNVLPPAKNPQPQKRGLFSDPRKRSSRAVGPGK